MNNSEIARIRQQIELESVAMQLAMSGFATVAKHEFISRKYDAIGKCQEQLQTLTGEQEATQITVEAYTLAMEQEGERSMQGFKDMARPLPLHQLTTPPLIEAAKEMIKQHGCEIVEHADYCLVTFPEGTRRAEIFPACLMSAILSCCPMACRSEKCLIDARSKAFCFCCRVESLPIATQ